MYANTSHLSPAARGVIATPASAAGTTAPIVSLYDLDTSSYDIDPDGRTVHIYGAAFFRTAPRDGVRFALVLSRADLRDDEAPAWIDFDSDDLEAAGLALAEETAEAALLDALRTPGFNVAGAPAVLTPSLIDFFCLPSMTAPAALSTSAPRPDGAFSPSRPTKVRSLRTYWPIDATAMTTRATQPLARPIGPMRAISSMDICPRKLLTLSSVSISKTISLGRRSSNR